MYRPALPLLLAARALVSSAAPAPQATPPPASPLPAAAAAPAPPAPTLTMAEAVRTALQNSPTLESARRERNVALIGTERDRPRLRPDLSAVFNGGGGSSSRRFFPGDTGDGSGFTSAVGLVLTMPLYQFGVGTAPFRRVEALAAAARSDYRKAELDTVLSVREGYLAVLRAQAFSGVAARGAELARANVTLTRQMVESGLKAEVDVLEAERAAAEAEARALEAANGVALAQANVNRLLGRAVDTPFTPSPEPLPAEPAALAELLPRALAQRPEVQSLKSSIAAAEAGVKLAKAASKPRVDLNARYQVGTGSTLAPGSDPVGGFNVLPDHYATAMVTITAPLFDGAGRRYTVREAEERLAQARSGLAALEGGIALELQQQRLAMAEARARRAVADRAVTAAEKALEITRLRAELGRAIQAEVQNARLGWERALSDRAAAENDLLRAQVRLARALGEGPPSATGE